MARIKLTEYRAKKLLDEHFSGHSIRLESLEDDCATLRDDMQYVVKVDQGVKHRGQQGLVKLNVSKHAVKDSIKELEAKGYSRFIAEPMVKHDQSEQRYLSFERTRNGMRILYSEKGGVNVEEQADQIRVYDDAANVPLPSDLIEHIISVMNTEHLSFVEINPLVVKDSNCILLDAAVLADSAAQYVTSWNQQDKAETATQYETESAIAELNANSPASFSFRVLNPNGSVWLLLSGGGASITIADAAYDIGGLDALGNYGEYSGGPTTDETYLYAKEVLKQMKQSNAPRKALVIAGGVANFTDVKQTFKGIVQALEEIPIDNLKVFVRRGGPNETEGLKSMKTFLEKQDLYGSVHGSEAVLTQAITKALEYVNA